MKLPELPNGITYYPGIGTILDDSGNPTDGRSIILSGISKSGRKAFFGVNVKVDDAPEDINSIVSEKALEFFGKLQEN